MSLFPPKFSDTYSFSMWALVNVRNWNEDTSKGIKIAKLITTEIVTALLIPVAVIESIVQALISLLVKTVHFFIPESRSGWFTHHIYKPTLWGTTFSFTAILTIPLLFVRNIKGGNSCNFALDHVTTAIDKGYNLCQPFINAHIDTILK